MADNIINMNSYKERKEKFQKSMKVNTENRIQVPNISRSSQGERYKAKKTYRKTSTKEKRKESKKKLIEKVGKKIFIAGLAGLLVFGGVKAYNEYRDSKNTLTLEQALENGETLQSLGINKEIEEELNELSVALEEDLTNEELIKLATKITGLQLDVAKTKIADTLEVEEYEIKLNASKGEDGANVYVDGKGTYIKDTPINNILGEKTISKEIEDYIDEIVKMQGIENDILKGDINREELVKAYEKAIEETSKFAAGELKQDKDGNLVLNKTRVSELEEKQNESKGYEIDD